MNDSRTNKTIKFEGAGWAEADTSKATNLKNCRIRSTFINDLGQKIYIELGCYDNRKMTSQTKWHRGYLMPWHINFLFFTKDRGVGCSPEFSDSFYQVREFTKENLLSFLKSVCKASFEDLETINWSKDRDLAEWDGFSHTGNKKDDFHLEVKK